MNEHDIQSMGRVALSAEGKFFRANVGEGYIGSEVIKITVPRVMYVYPGDIVIRNGRHFETGLPKGFSDVFGAVPEIITPAMVGQQIGVAAFVEFKTSTGRIRPEQQNFIEVMQSAGCRAGVARSPEEAVKIARGLG